MKKLIIIIGLIGPVVLQGQNNWKENIIKDITTLASDSMQGRGTGTEGEALALLYITSRFKEMGVLSKGEKDYEQSFKFKHNTNPHDSTSQNLIELTGKNIVGFIDHGAQYTIVIGAHYDHLGLGLLGGSLQANSHGEVHNGADDNASGVAGILALAQYFSEHKNYKYNILFIAFSGEELGLIGSKYWCEHPTIPLDQIAYMLNMDMIGRLNDERKMMVYGVGTSPLWGNVIHKANSNLKLVIDSAGVGPSDHTSFYLKGIPVLHFFTGQHKDYHKPSDDAQLINYDGEVDVLEFIERITEIESTGKKIEYLKTKAPDLGKEGSPFKITLGIMPDYTFEGIGLRIDGISDNKPAAKAGLQAGDIIQKLGNINIKSMADYMKALRTYEKGKTYVCKFSRNKKIRKTKISF